MQRSDSSRSAHRSPKVGSPLRQQLAPVGGSPESEPGYPFPMDDDLARPESPKPAESPSVQPRPWPPQPRRNMLQAPRRRMPIPL